jgi:hypothetical protein
MKVPCCRLLARAIVDDRFPIVHSSEDGVYFLCLSNNGRALLRFCPFCGETVFDEWNKTTDVTVDKTELERFDQLARDARSMADVQERLGMPVARIPRSGDVVCEYIFSEGLRTVDIHVMQSVDGSLAFTAVPRPSTKSTEALDDNAKTE